MSDFARTLKQDARDLRRYLILDCCFAASAFVEFQGTGVAETTRVKTLSEFPKKGTALLCACSAHDVALAPRGDQYTMFSGALLEVLKRGDPSLDFRLSLEQLGDRIKEVIKRKYPDTAVRPEVDSPDQREGDVADIPLFPNLALGPLQFRERLSRLEKTIETVLGKLSNMDKSVGVLTSLQERIGKGGAERGRINEEDVSELGNIRQEVKDKEWLRETLPTDVEVQLRIYRQARMAGLIWVSWSILVCLPSLFSLLGLPIRLSIFEGPYFYNPVFLLVLVFAAYFLGIILRDTFASRLLKSLQTYGEKAGPWERLPEVIAMRSTKTFPILGSVRIASPFFEVGGALFLVASLLYFIRIFTLRKLY